MQFNKYTHTHTHHRHKQPRRMRDCALVELVGLIGLARCQSYTPGSTVGRVVYHTMAAAAGAAVDVSAVFAVILAAYQQQQQRGMAVWNLIMDDYDDDTELDAENDDSTREIKRRRVYQRKDYKTSGWWQELHGEDLSDHTSRATRRHFIFKNVDSPSDHTSRAARRHFIFKNVDSPSPQHTPSTFP